MYKIQITGDIYRSPNIHMAILGDIAFACDEEVVIEGDLLIADSPEALSVLAGSQPVIELHNEED